MNITDLKTLLDSTNGELLLGNPTPIHEMPKDELETLIRRVETLYKSCIKIKISRSLRTYSAGLDFTLYEKQEQQRESKNKEKRESKVQRTAAEGSPAKRTPKPKGVQLTGDMSDMIKNMLAGFCPTHQKLKKECGCE